MIPTLAFLFLQAAAPAPATPARLAVVVQVAGDDAIGPVVAARVKQAIARSPLHAVVTSRPEADIVIYILSLRRGCEGPDGAAAVSVTFFRRHNEHFLGSMLRMVGVNRVDFAVTQITAELARVTRAK